MNKVNWRSVDRSEWKENSQIEEDVALINVYSCCRSSRFSSRSHSVLKYIFLLANPTIQLSRLAEAKLFSRTRCFVLLYNLPAGLMENEHDFVRIPIPISIPTPCATDWSRKREWAVVNLCSADTFWMLQAMTTASLDDFHLSSWPSKVISNALYSALGIRLTFHGGLYRIAPSSRWFTITSGKPFIQSKLIWNFPTCYTYKIHMIS